MGFMPPLVVKDTSMDTSCGASLAIQYTRGFHMPT